MRGGEDRGTDSGMSLVLEGHNCISKEKTIPNYRPV